MSTMIVNGQNINVPDGSSIAVKDNKIYVNGLEWKGEASGVVRIDLSGDIKEVKTDCSLHVHGNVNGSATAGGSIHCQNVGGHVQAGGSVHCGQVAGKVTAKGFVSFER